MPIEGGQAVDFPSPIFNNSTVFVIPITAPITETIIVVDPPVLWPLLGSEYEAVIVGLPSVVSK